MDLKSHLHKQLEATRAFSERLLADFREPEQWTYQVHPRCNHALWFAGHIANTDNFFISLIDPARAAPREGYQAKFGMGSQPTSEPADYPPPEDVLAYLRDRRATLLEILDGMDSADLDKPTPEGSPAFLPDYAAIFQSAIWHEGLHAGQLTVVRRGLGYPPVRGEPPAD